MDDNTSSNNYEECSICLDKLDKNKITISCGHTFHYSCIHTWLIKNNRCPLCRKFVKINFKANLSIKSKNICDIYFRSNSFGIKEFGLEIYYLPYFNYEYKFNEKEKRVLMINKNSEKNKFKVRNKLLKIKYEISLEFENCNEFNKFSELLCHIYNNFGIF